MLTPSPPSSLPRIREELSRRSKRIRGSRRSRRVDGRLFLPPRCKNSSAGSSLRAPRKRFRSPVNSFRAPRIPSRALDTRSGSCELISRHREFRRSHRNSLRSAPKELPTSSSSLPVTGYQEGKLHPSLGNLRKSFIDTGNSVAAPGSASQRREFARGVPEPLSRPPSPFAAPQSASKTIRMGSEPFCVRTQRCVFVHSLPKVAPSLSEFPQRSPCSDRSTPKKERGEGKPLPGIRVPSHAIRVPSLPRSLRSAGRERFG